MFKIKKKNQKCNGYVVAYLMIATSVGITILTGLVIFATNTQKKSRNDVARDQALEIAENGIYYYKWYLAHNLDGKNVQQIKNFWETGDPIGVDVPYEKEVQDYYGTGIGRYRIEVEPPDSSSTIVIVKSTGWIYRHPEIVKSVQVRFRRPSWSEYSVLANDVMRFGEGTNVFGKIHSNNGIRFDGVANNVITSAVEEYLDPDINQTKPGVWTSQSNEAQVFLAGKEFPVPSIDFNSITVDLDYMKNEAESGNGLYFGEGMAQESECHSVCVRWWWFFCVEHEEQCEEVDYPVVGYHVILGTGNTFQLKKVLSYSNNRYNITEETVSENYNYPDSGLIFFEKPVWVEGQINGKKITIASANLTGSGSDTNIYIEKDILYTNRDGRDIIGLIAQNDISVGYYSEDDLEIDAALLSQKGRVGRDHYLIGSYNWRDEITVYGSIATNERYGFAWTDGTGYNIRNLYFDNNLIYYPPPYFPTGTVYELDLWEDL